MQPRLPSLVEQTARRTAPLSRRLTALEEAAAFYRLRRFLTLNLLRQTFREARLRLLLVVGLSALFWLGLFWLFADGFHFLASSLPYAATRAQTVSAVFNLFFLSLLTMLIFSSGIILYSGLFRSRETEFLMVLPASAERVFLHKLQESLVFSSWGFLLLGSPMLVAYGLVDAAPWSYFLMLAPFMLAFIHIPCALGAIACLVIVRWSPARKFHLLICAVLAVGALAALAAGSLLNGPAGDLLTPAWFNDLLGRLEFSEQRLLPSWWLTSGLLNAAQGETSESFLFLCLLLANALFFQQLAVSLAGRLLWPAYRGSRGVKNTGVSAPMAWLDRLFQRSLFFLPRKPRLLITNDLRVFRRDPVQWTQFLIFFGLLGLYFFNIRRLSYDLSHATWVNMVSFLNLTVVGLILSTFTSRFVFPMISLEGRRFWILGRLPIRRSTILWSKFAFAAIGSLAPCLTLVLVSDWMLEVLPMILALHLVTCAMLCVGLAALAVGMGARMPNLREDSPSKIAAGFGGTLNLVASTIYIVAIVLLTALPCHFYLGALEADPHGALFNLERLRLWIALGAAGSVVLCLIATIVPLTMGIRAFNRLEF
ncbi:MAG: hypothetical protein K1X71_13590 [Pirellulales bacterium]|nr:hypothetical protein [Pirellulales bacterium]